MTTDVNTPTPLHEAHFDPALQPPDGAMKLAVQLHDKMCAAGWHSCWELGPVADREAVTQSRSALRHTESNLSAYKQCQQECRTIIGASPHESITEKLTAIMRELATAKDTIDQLRIERAGALHSSESWELLHAKRHEEVEILTRWKDEALQVMNELQMEKLAKLLGCPLGASASKFISARVPQIIEELKQAQAEIARLKESKLRDNEVMMLAATEIKRMADEIKEPTPDQIERHHKQQERMGNVIHGRDAS